MIDSTNPRSKRRTGGIRGAVAILGSAALLLMLCASAQADEFGLVPGSFETSLSTHQAGGHPDLRTKFQLARNPDNSPSGGPPKDFQITLPAGLIGAPASIPTCPLANAIDYANPCPQDRQVGWATVTLSLGGTFSLTEGVYSINPYPGEPAAFAFNALFPVRLDTFVRPDGDYGITITGHNLTEAAALIGTDLTFYGIPADHNGPGRQYDGNSGRRFGGPNPNTPRVPFLTNPTECSPTSPASTISLQSWQHPEKSIFAEYAVGPITGCNEVAFAPTIDSGPTTNLAEAPTGLEFNLHMPQHKSLVGVNEIQTVSVVATSGQFRLGFGGETSSDLPYNASAEELQAALESLPSIGAGNVAVNGGPGAEFVEGTPWVVSFQGPLGNSDVEEMTAEDGTEPLKYVPSPPVPNPPPASVNVTTTHPGEPGGSLSEENATAHLRDAAVTLPEGMTVNPPSAAGLDSCSMTQVGVLPSGLPTGSPVACPDASKLGTVRAVSPAIEHALTGNLYLATQYDNPLHALLGLYLVIDEPVTGILIKVPGKAEPDPVTGQLTISFKNNPQFPLEDLKLSLFEGPRAPLKTPSACGLHTTTSDLTPWSSPAGADVDPSSSFRLTAGPDGGACLPQGGSAANTPGFTAGTLNPTAKTFSPFVLKLTRADGTQQFKKIDTTLPTGMVAKLAGVSTCSDAALAAAEAQSGKAELASPSCPSGSQVGTVEIGSGAGSTPLYVGGQVYLAGPYKGAPASLAIVTPTVAGPLDLGTVVVRAALYIDPATVQVHVVSDPIPSILKGIPLDLRSVALSVSRPSFTLNPTSCDAKAVLGGVTSVFDQVVSLASPFQIGDCPDLGFKPSLKLALKGSVHRLAHPSLQVTLNARPNDANIAAARVKLPKSAFLDNDHIGDVCTRPQFAAHACPAGSIYGKATATSPLLDNPIAGPVYLRANPAHKLPDLVADLQGPSTQPIEIELAGKTDSVKGALRNTFEAVPDVPVTKFSLDLFGGKKGLVEMSGGFCAHPNASVVLDAQNGDSYSTDPEVSASCGKKGKKKKAKRNHGA